MINSQTLIDKHGVIRKNTHTCTHTHAHTHTCTHTIDILYG